MAKCYAVDWAMSCSVTNAPLMLTLTVRFGLFLDVALKCGFGEIPTWLVDACIAYTFLGSSKISKKRLRGNVRFALGFPLIIPLDPQHLFHIIGGPDGCHVTSGTPFFINKCLYYLHDSFEI